MKTRKLVSVLLALSMVISMMTACGSNGGSENSTPTPTPTQSAEHTDTTPTPTPVPEFWTTLDPNISGEITIAVKDGDGLYHEDIGSADLNEWDLTSQAVAQFYALAKKWKEHYPNVKINLYTIAGDWESTGVPWAQVIENFNLQYGKYPDIFMTNEVTNMMEKGLVSDLSIYKDDPLYQSMNTTAMDMINYYGMQGGLPWYIQLYGIWVNKTLAEQNNIDVPDADWTLDDYTEFIGSADAKNFWGSMDSPMGFLDNMTKDIDWKFTHRDGTGAYIDITTDAVKDILSYVPKWSQTTIWPQYEIGNVSTEVMDNGWWYDYHFFTESMLLTLTGSPWMMKYATGDPGKDNTCEFDFDIYPQPSSDYVGSHVGIAVDPIVIYNYALSDGNSELSESEKAQLDLAYAFASWMTATTEAMQAMAEQQYNPWGVLESAAADSLPKVGGEAFDEQMELWYQVPGLAPYKEKEGWTKCIELYKDEQFWGINNKTMPVKTTIDGVATGCYWEWQSLYSTITARRASDEFIDEIKSRLTEWNETFNERFAQADNALKESLKSYYGFTDADFN